MKREGVGSTEILSLKELPKTKFLGEIFFGYVRAHTLSS